MVAFRDWGGPGVTVTGTNTCLGKARSYPGGGHHALMTYQGAKIGMFGGQDQTVNSLMLKWEE